MNRKEEKLYAGRRCQQQRASVVVVARREFRAAEFMALLKYLTRRRVREMRVAVRSFRRAWRMHKMGRVRVRYFHMMHRSCRGRSHSRTFMYPISLGHFPNHQTLGGSALPLLLLGETIQRDFDEYHVER